MNGEPGAPDSPLTRTLSFLLGAGVIITALAGYALGWWHEPTAEEFTMGLLVFGGSLIARRRTERRKLQEMRAQTETLQGIRQASAVTAVTVAAAVEEQGEEPR